MSDSSRATADAASRERTESTDTVLVQRAAGGDPHAFELLVRRYQQRMYRVALRVTERRDDAEDATQNAFLAAWRRLPQFRRDAAFDTWLYRIVTNYALNIVRGRQHRDREHDLTQLPDHDHPAGRETGPQQHAETGALADELRSALATLPLDLRIAWYAREIDGYSYQQVAEIAGVSLDAVRGRISRARRHVAARLGAWR